LGVDWKRRFWWKAGFHLWNHPKPAPEYQLGWKDNRSAKKSLNRILAWDLDRVIIAHGDLVESNAREALVAAWNVPLQDE